MKIEVKHNSVENIEFDALLIKTPFLEATLFTLGASLYSLKLLIENEKREVLVTPRRLRDFIAKDFYFGKTIGRLSGRVDKGILNFNNNEYVLEKNWNDTSFLHGGSKGVSTQNFEYEIFETPEIINVVFSLLVKEEYDGIPGNINLKVIYSFYENIKEVHVSFIYEPLDDSLASFTNHACFNLDGQGDILSHELYINADTYYPMNEELIPLEESKLSKVMNFKDKHLIGDYINDDSLQSHTVKGYDHSYHLNSHNDTVVAASLTSSDKKITLNVKTTCPYMHIYTANYEEPIYLLSTNEKFKRYNGICFELSYLVNSFNKGNKETYIKKNKLYSNYIVYEFEF